MRAPSTRAAGVFLGAIAVLLALAYGFANRTDRRPALSLDEARAQALRLDAGLTRADVDLLSAAELRLTLPSRRPVERAFVREVKGTFARETAVNAGEPTLYTPLAASSPSSGVEAPHFGVVTNEGLPALSITVDVASKDSAYPTVSVAPARDASLNAFYYFEFDVVPSFDSPNLWRSPSLMALATDARREYVHNLTLRDGLIVSLFVSNQREAGGKATRVTFPFRVSAMRLPTDRSRLTFDELERHAAALAFGLEPTRIPREVFEYGKHVYAWASDTERRSPLACFRAGLGECAHINALIGAYLELNGIRTRLVSGLNPQVRTVRPGGGHTLIEYFDPAQDAWRVLDSYLDLFAPDASIEAIATGAHSSSTRSIYPLPDGFQLDGAPTSHLTLGALFRYRRYGDSLRRSPMVSGLALRAAGKREADYGTDWKLNEAKSYTAEELFAERQTIHVRARYVVAPEALRALGHAFAAVTVDGRGVEASPWATASFVTQPRVVVAAR